jgi:DNA-binding NtrC family response regulator
MVIDPERDFAEMVAEYLMLKANYHVVVADEAMEIGFVGGRLVPEVVLYDPDTPGVPAAKLAAHLREQREDTKLFLLTGYVDSRIEAMADKLGAEGVLQKPLKLDELLTLLTSLQF